MKLFDKRNVVLLMAIFLLFMMVSSISAADVNEDAVVGNDAAIDTITSTDTYSGSVDDVISAEVSDNSIVDPSDSEEKLSDEIVADASSNDDNSNDNTVDDSSQDVLKASADDEVLSADVPIDLTLHVGPGQRYSTLQDAIDALPRADRNYEIVIHEGTYTGEGNRDVHIRRYAYPNMNFQYLLIRAADGETVTFDGRNRYNIFSVRSSNVHIQGINFINANTSSNDNGGVCISISNGADHITIDQCNFTNNGKDSTYGGAIRVNDGSQDINITNCYFENNTASVGGGIRSEQSTSGIHIINCTAVHNYGSTHGGFACLFGSDTVLENCTFEDNYAPSSGAVHCHNGNVTVKNCTFINNSAIGGGTNATNGYAGALGLVYTGSPGVTVLDSHFYNNTAVNDGGAVQVMGTGRDAKIINSDFENNTAAYGGALSIKGANTQVTNSNFTNNEANTTDDTVGGGAVYIEGSGTNIAGSTFANNTAVEEGGAVFVKGNDARIVDSTLADNTAGDDGGAIYWEGNNGIVDKVNCTNNTGTSENGNSKGGAMTITGNNLKISNSTFTSDSVIGSDSTDGGALFITGNNVVIADSNFTDCNASRYGGAIQVIGNHTNITNCNFEENNAIPNEDKIDDGLGGAVYIQGTDCHVTDSNFVHNTARNGSAIYVNPEGTTGTNYIDNCNFFENQAWVYWLPILYDEANQKIETNLTGGNNIINAIYNNGSRQQLIINGSVPADGWENSQGGTVPYQDDLEADQEIIIVVYDREGNVVFNETRITNLSGTVSVDIPADTSYWFIINMTHTEDPYYKNITNITAININPGITVNNVTMYEGNESAQDVVIDLIDNSGKPIADGEVNVTVLYNGQEIQIGSGKTSSTGVLEILEETYFKTFEPGNYTIKAEYSYLYYNVTTGEYETKTLTGEGNLEVLPYEWNLTKTIIAVNGKPYEDGMEIHVNDNITFNITVSNLVDADITSVQITDLDTENLTYVETVGSGWNYVGNNVWSLDNLPAKGNSSLIVTFLITNNGTSINVANASIFNGKENKSANVSFAATNLVVLDITKEANVTEVYVNGTVTFIINVTNNGQSNANNAVITDVLNNAFEYVSSNPEANVEGQTVTWTIDQIKPGQTISVEVVVKVLANGTFNNTAAVVCDENKTETNNSTNITVRNVVLDVTKVANATEVYVGDNVTFTITVVNSGDGNATNANITDKLDPNFAWVSGGSYDEATHTVTWNIGNLNAGESTSVDVVVTVLANGTFNNTAVVVCDENKTETNNSTNITVRNVVLDITKEASAKEVYVGDEVTFTITVTNNGDGNATNANITDVLDVAFEYVSSSNGGSYDESTRTVTWNIGQIDAGETTSVTVTVKVLSNGTINNTAVVVSDENKTETNNSTNITAKPFVSLEITKEGNATDVLIGEEVEFTITVTNNGKSNATNVVIADAIPEGFEPKDFNGQVTIDLIEPGKSATIKVVVIATKAGEWINTANATCTENDTVVKDSADAVIVHRLTITIVVGNYTTTPGTLVPVEITVVDQRGNPVTINLTVVVTGAFDNSTLPEHEGKLVFTITTDLGADGDQVEIKEGQGIYEYQVPDTAKNGTSYVVTASSEETDQYNAAEGTGYIDIIQYSTNTTISDATGKPGETVTLDVTVTTEDGTPFNGDVVVTCPDGTEVTVTVKDGKGSFDWTIPEDAKDGDEFKFTATFNGNSTYLASSGNGTVSVVDEEEEPQPEPEEPQPEPEEPVTPEEEPEVTPEPEVVPAKMLNTGNPLVALLAAFVLIGLGLKRREEE